MGPSISDIESALNRVKDISRVLSVILQVAFIACGAAWLLSFGCVCANMMNPGLLPPGLLSDTTLLMSILIGGTITLGLLRTAILVVRDVGRGESPFTLLQANRIRLIAILIAVYAVFDSVWLPGLFSGVSIGDVSFGVYSSGNIAVFQVNIGLLVAALLFFILSIVFRYGTLLQSLSDETV